MTKYAAYGTALLMDGTEIGQVTSISGPGLTLDTVDVTTHDGDGWEEVVPTILRSGEVTLDLIFDPVVHADQITGLTTKGLSAFELQFPDDAYSSWEFDAYVVGLEPSAGVEEALTASMTLKISGQPTLTGTYSP